MPCLLIKTKKIITLLVPGVFNYKKSLIDAV